MTAAKWAEGEDVIGTLKILVPHDFRLTYECAAWSKTLRVEAGVTADLLEVRSRFNGHARTAVLARVPVVVTQASFRSRLGASYGADRGPEEVGRQETETVVVARRDAYSWPCWTAGSYGPWSDKRDQAVRSWQNGAGFYGAPTHAPATWARVTLNDTTEGGHDGNGQS